MRLSLGRARPVGGGASARSQAHGRAVCRCLHVSLRQIRRDRTAIFVRASESGSAEPNADSPEMKQMKEIAALDQLIDLMLDCKSQDELVQTVAQNILSFDQRFWMRLATRADITQEAEAKEKLQALASTVMSLVDAMVKKTENQLSDAGKVLQEIMVAAADDNGEWSMPLPPDKRAAMQKAMDERAEHLDEALLSNAFAWIRKVSEDRLDGMVALLQQVLQMYAAKMLVKQDPEEGADTVVNNILAAEEARWESMLEEAATSGMIGEPALMDALQKRMEGIVLSLPSGSYAQRVQAEYLKEVEARAKAVYKRLAEL